jgi:hypothetical protein
LRHQSRQSCEGNQNFRKAHTNSRLKKRKGLA